jgi:hypothetical protein
MSEKNIDQSDDSTAQEFTEGSFEAMKSYLERLAISTYIDILTDSKVDPKVKKDAADKIMQAIGKASPPPLPKGASPNNTLIFSFSDGIQSAVRGMGVLQKLVSKEPQDETKEGEE